MLIEGVLCLDWGLVCGTYLFMDLRTCKVLGTHRHDLGVADSCMWMMAFQVLSHVLLWRVSGAHRLSVWKKHLEDHRLYACPSVPRNAWGLF